MISLGGLECYIILHRLVVQNLGFDLDFHLVLTSGVTRVVSGLTGRVTVHSGQTQDNLTLSGSKEDEYPRYRAFTQSKLLGS